MKGMKCICGKVAAYTEDLTFNGNPIDGWVCEYCGEEYHNPEKAEKILLLNKLKMHKYHLKLSQVKSNLILRIPKEVGEALNLHKGGKVDLGINDTNQIVIDPLAANLYQKA